jgi:hypothetical protein
LILINKILEFNGNLTYIFKCKCGILKQYESKEKSRSIFRGRVKSCGCLQIDSPLKFKDVYKTSYLTHWKTGEVLFCMSSYETKTINYLNENRINFKWQIPIKLSQSTYYIDLYLEDSELYVEIKGFWRKKAIAKYNEFVVKYRYKSEIWDGTKLRQLGILKKGER